MFVKESDAVALFPGGFGTHDEGFEALTLVQTGKSHLFPIVCVDEPGGTYWKQWQEFVEQQLLHHGLISPADTSLYKVTDSVDEAVAEIARFYRVYHSMRYVGRSNDLVIRLHRPISDETLADVRREFADIVKEGTIERAEPAPAERNEPTLLALPRLRFRFDRHGLGRLRQMIDRLNRDGEPTS